VTEAQDFLTQGLHENEKVEILIASKYGTHTYTVEKIDEKPE
jgi:hypothetical protein